MPVAANLDWLYQLLGYTLAGAALLLLLWALFWDRSRGRKRCPKCWYDMSGVPGLRCPECGRQVKHERGLFKTRRRRLWTGCAIILCAFGLATSGVPRYRAGGWLGLVPSTYLVYFATANDTPSVPSAAAIWMMSKAAPVPNPTVAQLLTNETWDRLERGSMWLWQSHVYLRRVMKADGVDPDEIMCVPKVWPLGVKIPCSRSSPSIGGLSLSIDPPGAKPVWYQPVLHKSWFLPAVYEPTKTINGVVRWGVAGGRVVYRSRKMLPMEARLPVAEFMTRVESPESTDEVRAMLCPHIAERDGRVEFILYNRPDHEARKKFPFVVAFICEVRHGDRILATKHDDAPYKPNSWVMWSASRIEWPDDALEIVRRGEATVTIRGDYNDAIGVYISHPYDPPSRACWTGQFTEPLLMKPHPRKK
jgi:hypothetical protein